MRASRWLAVGQADGPDPEAGARAADRALAHADAKLLIVFCSVTYDVRALVRQIRARAQGVPLIGCSTAGEITTNGPSEAGVVVMALGGDGFSIKTAVAAGASGDLRAAGAQAADCVVSDGDRPYRVLLLLTDGLAGDQQQIVRGAYGVLGAGVPLVGGCAGDDLKMTRTLQLHDDQVLTDAVVAAGIASDAPLGIGVRHGWRRVGEPMLVTCSSKDRVHTLDDGPALDVYLERLAVPAQACSNSAEFGRISLTHPLGLSRRIGEEQVRFVGADFAERSLICRDGVPQGALAWIMEGDAASVLGATEAACHDSLAALAGHPPLGMLAFDCISRRSVLGDQQIRAEIDRITASAGGAPIAGFYTYGEIARTHGMSGFHNQTVVILSVA